MDDIIKIVKSLEESSLLIKPVSETTKKEAKEQKAGFIGVLLNTLGASLLRNALAGKGIVRGCERVILAGEGVVRVEQGVYCCFIL